MIYNSQFAYDNAEPEPISDYCEEPMFAEFVEYVALELLAGRDCQGIGAQMFMIDLELSGGGYQMALEWVSERMAENQYRDWISDY